MLKMIRDFLTYRSAQKRQASPEPYFDFKILEVKGSELQVVMDWNEAFISKLRNLGYEGITDEQLIENYLHRIFYAAYMKNYMDQPEREL